MTKNRIAKSVAVTAGCVFLLAMSGLTHAQNASTSAVRAPMAASHGVQSKSDSNAQDDFAGLNYTDEQKAQIDKIHQLSESHKAVVAKDEKLNNDQKNAMLLGYTRIEYGQVFQVLSPAQQKQVRQRMAARRAADQAEHKKQAPPGK